MRELASVTWRAVWGEVDGLVVLVGDRGAILRSADHGRTWLRVRSPTRLPLVAVHGLDAIVIAVGRDGTVLRSENRGASWWLVRQGGPDLDVVLVGDDHRVVAGGRRGALLLSSDSGARWSARRVPGVDLVVGGAVGAGGQLHVLASEGMLLSEQPGALRSWVATTLPLNRLTALTARGLALYAADARGRVARSFDRGATWSPFAAGGADRPIRSLWAHPDGERVLAVGDAGTAVWSGGGRWQALSGLPDADLFGVWGDGRGRVFVVGAAGVYLSTDDGYAFQPLGEVQVREVETSWVSAPCEGQLSGLWLGTDHLLAYGASGAISHSPDLGRTWHRGEIDAAVWVHDVWGAPRSGIVHAAAADRMLRSTDGGRRWRTAKTLREPVVRLSGASERHRVALTARSLLVGTETAPWWRQVPLPPGLLGEAVAVGDTDTVVVVGADGAIARTTDRGATWGDVLRVGKQRLNAVSAGPDGTFHAVGQAGVVLRSVDDGRTFHRVATPARDTLRDVVTRGDEVFIGGDGGTVLWSIDRGDSYGLDVTGGTERIARVVVAQHNVWALAVDGQQATLLRRPR